MTAFKQLSLIIVLVLLLAVINAPSAAQQRIHVCARVKH